MPNSSGWNVTGWEPCVREFVKHSLTLAIQTLNLFGFKPVYAFPVPSGHGQPHLFRHFLSVKAEPSVPMACLKCGSYTLCVLGE